MSDETTYKVMFHEGDEIGLATRGETGRLWHDDEAIFVEGTKAFEISCELLREVELFRMHKIGSVIRVTHANGTLFVTVVRFSLFGLFALINRHATRQLAEELRRRISSRPFG